MSLDISFVLKHQQIKRTGHMKSQNQLVLQPIVKNMLHFTNLADVLVNGWKKCTIHHYSQYMHTSYCCMQPILPACHRILNSSAESTEQTRTKRALVSYPSPTGGIVMDCTNKTMHCSTVTKKAGSQTQRIQLHLKIKTPALQTKWCPSETPQVSVSC